MLDQVGSPGAQGVGVVGSAPPLVVYVTLQALPGALVLPGAGGYPGGSARRPADQIICEVGDRIMLSTLFMSDAGVPENPDHGPWFRIAGPASANDGGPVTVWGWGDPAIQSDGNGSFTLPWTPLLPGRYFWRVWATGEIERAHVGSLVVLPDPSNRNPGGGGSVLPSVAIAAVGSVV